MPWWVWLAGLALLSALAALLVWLLVVTEGAYLGPGVVTALYDRFAGRYDRIKQFDDADEAHFLGEPVERYLANLRLGAADRPWLLDVAAGTGRFSLAVLRASEGRCRFVALDRSRLMLLHALAKLARENWSDVVCLQYDASRLPFADGQFQVVACLEALEFMPDPRTALCELLRVARPGGLVVLTNRIGRDARMMPGKTFSRMEMGELLRAANAGAVDIRPWQVDYDLVMALKAEPADVPADGTSWPAFVRCASCGADQSMLPEPDAGVLRCTRCGWCLRLDDGIWHHVPGLRS